MVTLQGIRFLLLLFALVGFAGAGSAFALARHRARIEEEQDVGLFAVAGMFLLFGILCTLAASGLFGILAFGGVVLWASYVIMAQRVGLFSIEARIVAPPEPEPTEHRT
jgi:threonine/homoserine efflux transporter RhtA